MLRLTIAAALLAGTALAAQAQALPERVKTAGKIVIATQPNYPPIAFKDVATNQLSGFDIELGEAIAKELGVTVEWQETAFAQMLPSLQTGRVDAVMAGMIERKHGTLVMMSSIAGRKVYPDHTVYCGTKFFVHAVSESLREYLAPHDVRVIVLSPGIIDTEVLGGVRDPQTLAAYKANKEAIGGGIGADIVAGLILDAYQLPQRAIVQEIVITPTRQKY